MKLRNIVALASGESSVTNMASTILMAREGTSVIFSNDKSIQQVPKTN